MAYSADLFDGLATLLASKAVGVYRPDGSVYTADEVAIVSSSMPPAPDRCIVLAQYAVSDDVSLSDSVVGVQARCRAPGQDPDSVQDIADGVFGVLQGLWSYTLHNGLVITLSERQSGTPMGQDESNRWEHSDNYYLTVHRPSPNRE